MIENFLIARMHILKHIDEIGSMEDEGKHEIEFEHDIYRVYSEIDVTDIKSPGDELTPMVDEKSIYIEEIEITVL